MCSYELKNFSDNTASFFREADVSLMPSFYSIEAEKKGARPSQVFNPIPMRIAKTQI